MLIFTVKTWDNETETIAIYPKSPTGTGKTGITDKD
uniref:Uncharacterized protein n=1 Tax=Anguilla anguilla TaxID=7936 RepID=A0A0E9PM31_ANGAN